MVGRRRRTPFWKACTVLSSMRRLRATAMSDGARILERAVDDAAHALGHGLVLGMDAVDAGEALGRAAASRSMQIIVLLASTMR